MARLGTAPAAVPARVARGAPRLMSTAFPMVTATVRRLLTAAAASPSAASDAAAVGECAGRA